MKEKIDKIRNTQKGITLVALVITIIVMLLLSVVSINLIQNLGLIEKVKLAKEEHRASTIQEQKELFEKEIEISKYEGNTPKTINDLLNKLEEEKLITEEEKNTIMQTGRITIGSKEIIFSEDAKLPDGYTRCEYLESTGTQYIDTGITTDLVNDVKWKLKTAITKYTSNSLFMGANGNAVLGYTQTSIGVPSGMTNYAIGDAVELIVHKNMSNERYLYYLNEIYKGSNASKSGRNIFLFANDVNGTGAYKIYCRIYYSKIYINDELVRNMIPCIDATGRHCMYDTVTGQTFYNQGTGEFIAGPIVE